LDVNGSALATDDTRFDFYSDCSSGTKISSVMMTSGSFETTIAIRTTATPPNDRKLAVAASGLTAAALYFNVTPQADHLALSLNRGNPVYEGSCVPVDVRAENASNNLISTATFSFTMNAHGSLMHPGEFQSPCGDPPSNGPFTLATGEYFGIGFKARSPGTGYKMEAQSMFQKDMRQLTFDILSVPAASRPSNIRLHMTSDELPPNETALTSWPQPQSTTLPMPSTINFSGPVSTGPTPKDEGAILNSNQVAAMLSPYIPNTSTISVSARIKLAALPASTMPLLAIRNTNPMHSINLSLDNSGNLSGHDLNVSLSPNQTYTISLHKSANNLSLFVNGTQVGMTSTGPNPNTAGDDYNEIAVGPSPYSLKALIMYAGIPDVTSAQSVISTDHGYLLNRVP
jgi:hypothetical protein